MNKWDVTIGAGLAEALEQMREALTSSFMSVEEFGAALMPSAEERPKYDPYQARAMWQRPCPRTRYREKRPCQMVRHNPVARKRPVNNRRRRQ